MDNMNLNNNYNWALTSLAISDIMAENSAGADRAKPSESEKEEAINRYKDGDRSDEVLRILDRTDGII